MIANQSKDRSSMLINSHLVLPKQLSPTIMKLVIATLLAGSAAAFAPAQVGKATTALNGDGKCLFCNDNCSYQ